MARRYNTFLIGLVCLSSGMQIIEGTKFLDQPLMQIGVLVPGTVDISKSYVEPTFEMKHEGLDREVIGSFVPKAMVNSKADDSSIAPTSAADTTIVSTTATTDTTIEPSTAGTDTTIEPSTAATDTTIVSSTTATDTTIVSSTAATDTTIVSSTAATDTTIVSSTATTDTTAADTTLGSKTGTTISSTNAAFTQSSQTTMSQKVNSTAPTNGSPVTVRNDTTTTTPHPLVHTSRPTLVSSSGLTADQIAMMTLDQTLAYMTPGNMQDGVCIGMKDDYLDGGVHLGLCGQCSDDQERASWSTGCLQGPCCLKDKLAGIRCVGVPRNFTGHFLEIGNCQQSCDVMSDDDTTYSKGCEGVAHTHACCLTRS